jgi:hypothetical protein
MGMGTFGVHLEAISADNLKKICPEAFSELESELNRIGGKWSGLAQGLESHQSDCLSDYLEDIEEEDYDYDVLSNLWLALTADFSRKTGGLMLSATYYEESMGDRYDEPFDHDGMIFTLDGVYQLTPAAEKIKDMIVRSSFTVFG